MRLFISYAHQDIEKVKELVDILATSEHECWYDHKLTISREWQEQLLEEIRNCDAFVYVLTIQSIGSEWCQWEFEQASLMNKPIIGVLVEESARPVIPKAIKKRQYADFTQGMQGREVARLLSDLNKLKIPKREIAKAPEAPRGIPARADAEMAKLYDAAIAITLKNKGVSISLLERELSISHGRAGRLVVELERQGIIGAYPGGNKLRPLIKAPPQD